MESKVSNINSKSEGAGYSNSKNENYVNKRPKSDSGGSSPSKSPSVEVTSIDRDDERSKPNERMKVGESQQISMNRSQGLVTLKDGQGSQLGNQSSLTIGLADDRDGDPSIKTLPFTTAKSEKSISNSLTTNNKTETPPVPVDAYVINWKPVDVTGLPHTNNTTSRLFIEQNLRYHNVLRAKHAAPPLQLDEKMCRTAQAWVNQMAKEGRLQLSGYGLGENSYWSSEPLVNGNIPVLSWYREGENFNWAVIDHQKGTGHYTQIIWKATERLGVAVSTTSAGTFVVAFYDPPGNFIGQYSDNLTMPL